MDQSSYTTAEQAFQNIPELQRENFVKVAVDKTSDNEQKKQIALTAMKAVPPPLQEDLSKETFKYLGDEQKKRVATAAVKEVPPSLQEDVVRDVAKTLDPRQRRDLAHTIFPEPENKVINQIWLIVIGSLSIAMIISVVCLAFSIFHTPNQNVQMLLTVFTAIVAFFGGLLTPKPSTQ